MTRTRLSFLLSLLFLLVGAGPAAAATVSPVVFGGYWSEFVAHWQGVFQKQDGIAWGVIIVGIVALFIITRGKWMK